MLHDNLDRLLKITTTILLIGVAVALTACSSGDDVPGKVTVRYARWGLMLPSLSRKTAFCRFPGASDRSRCSVWVMPPSEIS